MATETPASMTEVLDDSRVGSDTPSDVRALYDQLRLHRPVHWSGQFGGHWVLTRFEDVATAASDSRTFISSVRAVVPSDPRGLRRPPLNFDAPLHTPYRRALDRTLQRRRLTRLEDPLRAHARAALQPLLDNGGGDIVTSYASLFPAWVTAEWLNLDAAIAPVLATTAAEWVDAWRRQDATLVNERSGQMYQIARDLVADRSTNPRPVDEDPASSLLAELHEGEPLNPDHLVGALRQSLVVGMVAPPIVIGAVAEHLGTDLELQRRLRTEPDILDDAVEEFIRLYTPYRGFARTVVQDTVLHGTLIRPGVPVTLSYASANRDPEQFEDPNTFVLNRPNIHEHLGFGRGRHRCAGMPLARLALRIAIQVLLEETKGFRARTATSFAQMPELGPISVQIDVTR